MTINNIPEAKVMSSRTRSSLVG